MNKNRIHEIRLIVAGTRTFDDYVLMKEKLDQIILGLREDYSGAPVVIISGNAKGADQLGIRYAMERNLSFRRFPAQWHQYGKAAGPMRNAQMLAYAKEGIPALVAFWDGKSRGTDNMIQAARRGKAFVRVIPYEAEHRNYSTRKITNYSQSSS